MNPKKELLWGLWVVWVLGFSFRGLPILPLLAVVPLFGEAILNRMASICAITRVTLLLCYVLQA